MPFSPSQTSGTLHTYAPRLVAFEHTSPTPSTSATTTLLFLGGLCDGLLTVHYIRSLASSARSLRVVEVLLSSSYTGWATSSLARDADELALAVRYFRSLPGCGGIVLMGHSTGCQIAMEYLVGPFSTSTSTSTSAFGSGSRPPIDALVLQAGISDRESLDDSMSADKISAAIILAHRMVDEGRGADIMPRSATNGLWGPEPSATRFLSLVEVGGLDDYFSSDLPDEILETSFGRLGAVVGHVLILLSGSDEHMPKSVNKEALVERWVDFVEHGGALASPQSGVVPAASHNLNRSEAAVVDDLVARVAAFVLEMLRSRTSGGRL